MCPACCAKPKLVVWQVSRELGLTLTSERESVCDMAVSLIRLQAAKPVFAELTSDTSQA
jgi:hypothetical protein